MSEAHAMIGGESCRAGRRASSNSQNSTEEQTVTVVPEDSEIRVASESETLCATPTRMSSGSASAPSASSSSSPANIMSQFREGKSRSARVLVDAKNLILGNTDSAAAQLRRENEIKERRRQMWAEYAKFSRSVNHPQMIQMTCLCACSLLRLALFVGILFYLGVAQRLVPLSRSIENPTAAPAPAPAPAPEPEPVPGSVAPAISPPSPHPPTAINSPIKCSAATGK